MTPKQQLIHAARTQAANPLSVRGVMRDIHHFTGGRCRIHPDDAARTMSLVIADMEKLESVPPSPNVLRDIVNASYAAALYTVIAEVRNRSTT